MSRSPEQVEILLQMKQDSCQQTMITVDNWRRQPARVRHRIGIYGVAGLYIDRRLMGTDADEARQTLQPPGW